MKSRKIEGCVIYDHHRIAELALPVDYKNENHLEGWSAVIAVKQCILGASCHPDFDCPVLWRPQKQDDGLKIVNIQPKVRITSVYAIDSDFNTPLRTFSSGSQLNMTVGQGGALHQCYSHNNRNDRKHQD
jgi:hypothetical protein